MDDGKLHQVFHVTVIHVIKVLIFADHSPDKCVSLGATAGVDGPAREMTACSFRITI